MTNKIKVIKLVLFSILVICFILNGKGFIAGEPKIVSKDSITMESIDWESLMLDHLKLTIYYNNLLLLTNYSVNEEDLINGYYEYKIIVKTSVLWHCINILQELSKENLSKLDTSTRVNIRAYCEFTTDTKKVFSFSLESG